MRISSPQPSVLHLVTLFRMISAGEIRIPAFQRNFVWSEKQVVELLESVNDGFPIGSILLWAVEHKVLRIAPIGATSFPDVPEAFPTSYVLDGMQRLTTLFGVFNFGATTDDSRFDVIYDLDNRVFFHRMEHNLLPHCVPLTALFSPRSLLDHQARISELHNADQLLDALLSVQAAFQEYMVPVVTIRSSDIQRVVGIFEKINSTGTRLDTVDFMRAITWAEEFDLNHYLDECSEALSAVGANVGPETLIKCVGLTLGVPPTSEGLLNLRMKTPVEMAGAFSDAVNAIKRVMDFLAAEMDVYSSNLIPYEGQFLLLVRAIGLDGIDAEEAHQLKRWLWAVGFNEGLRGKPDHYVVRAVDDWRGSIQGHVRGLEPRLKLSEADFAERRLLSGGALSATLVAMFGKNGASDFVNRATFHPSGLNMADVSVFQPVFSRDEMRLYGFPSVVSAKLLANVVIWDQPGSSETIRAAIMKAADRDDWVVLHSQFIDKAAVSALDNWDIHTFMMARAALMHKKASELVGAS